MRGVTCADVGHGRILARESAGNVRHHARGAVLLRICTNALTFIQMCVPSLRSIVFLAATLAGAPHAIAGAAADPAVVLHTQYVALTQALALSTIQPGLHVESIDSSRAPRGDAYAVINYPFATVTAAFTTPAILCEPLILHLNVQYCRETAGDEQPALSVALGKKTNQALEDTHRIKLLFNVAASSADFMRVELTADKGPLGTGNYLIALELIALDREHSFMHIRYSYTQGFMARVATSIYFATSGRDKVGFTLVKDDADDPPHLVGGIRGALERNTMRYYLAFDAYLQTLDQPKSQRFEQSIERWFSETERFSRQLHEVKRDDYLAMKRGQYLRQQIAPAAPPQSAAAPL